MIKFDCKICKKEVTLKDGKKFNRFFAVYAKNEKEVGFIDVQVAKKALYSFDELFKKNSKKDNINLSLNFEQDAFIAPKTDKNRNSIFNKKGEPIYKLVIVNVTNANILDNLVLPSRDNYKKLSPKEALKITKENLKKEDEDLPF